MDDGMATGLTAMAALQALRARKPARLVLAAPIAAPDMAAELARLLQAADRRLRGDDTAG